MIEPKSFYTKKGPSLTMNKRAAIAVVVVAVIAAAFVLLQSQTTSKKTDIKSAVKTEENALYSKAEIDAFIKNQLSANQTNPKESAVKTDVNPAVVRKLKTGIAVFVKKKEEVRPVSAISTQSTNLGIPTGSKIKAHLANAIFSYNVTSPAVVIADEDYIKDGETVIPEGTQFIGEAAVQKSRDRINVRFSVMVLPGGKEMKVTAMALSLDGSGGIKGKVDKEINKSIFKAMGETVLAGGALVLGNRGNSALSLNDELRLNAARNLSDDARNSLNQVKVEESVSVEAYTPVLVLFLKPL